MSTCPGPTASALATLDASLFRVPFEHGRRAARTEQKHLDKELASASSNLKDVLKRLADGSVEDATASLDAVANRLSQLKRKLRAVRMEEEEAMGEQIPARLRHQEALNISTAATMATMATTAASAVDSSDRWLQWNETNAMRLAVDHLLRRGGHIELTTTLTATQPTIAPLVDTAVYKRLNEITAMLVERKRCKEALVWAVDNRSILRKVSSTIWMEHELRLQEYIELVRERKLPQAISYARQHLGKLPEAVGDAGGDGDEVGERWRGTVRRAMGLLAFPPTHAHLPPVYAAFYDPGRWNMLRDMVFDAFNAVYSLPSTTLLEMAVRAGLAAIKTPSCMSAESYAPMCPACAPLLHDLAMRIPRAHHTHSTIVCGVTGLQGIGGSEAAGVGPNGRVYSMRAFEEGAARSNGWFEDPVTGEKCSLADVKRLYIT